MSFVLLVILLVLMFGGLPQVSGGWHSFGYAPSGLLGLMLIILVVLVLMGMV